jgi:glycine/D-amino acid oxidase-like deaminating enzyme
MTRTRYGVAPWLSGAPKKPGYPPLSEGLDVEVAIVGGGLAGAATAYASAAAGLRVALLEAGRIGHGSSGRGAGLILQNPPVRFAELEDRLGRRSAKAVWSGWRRAALELAAAERRLALRSRLSQAAAVTWARSAAEARLLERELTARRAAGFDAIWVTGRALAGIGLEGAGAIRTKGDATVDPARLAKGFARAAASRGAALFERTRAVSVSHEDKGALIKSARGSVRCKTVVVATGDAGDLFEPLARHLVECASFCVQTPPLPGPVRKAIQDHDLVLQDCDDPPHRLAWTTGERILWTGADAPRTPDRLREQAVVQRTGQLMYELSLVLPAISGIQPEHGWDVPYSVARDGLPLIGPHRNYPHHLFALGLGTDPAAAFLASRIVVRHLTSTVDKADDAFGFARVSR